MFFNHQDSFVYDEGRGRERNLIFKSLHGGWAAVLSACWEGYEFTKKFTSMANDEST